MKNYIELLKNLDAKNSMSNKDVKQVVFLSGQSDYFHSSLSEEQIILLNYILQYGYSPIKVGFPYNNKHNFQNCKRANIFMASIRNIQQFYYCIFSKNYKKLIAKHLQPIFDSMHDTVLICQSSGLNMLKVSLPYMKINNKKKIIVIALGPVVYGRFSYKGFNLSIIKGRKDWISNLIDKNMADYEIYCNHFGYCKNSEIFSIIKRIMNNEN